MASVFISNKVKHKAQKIETADYSISKIIQGKKQVRINEVLPFRVRFTTITVPGYSSTNIPGIGIQVIGFSNYIL
jgi:hypothetical protein